MNEVLLLFVCFDFILIVLVGLNCLRAEVAEVLYPTDGEGHPGIGVGNEGLRIL